MEGNQWMNKYIGVIAAVGGMGIMTPLFMTPSDRTDKNAVKRTIITRVDMNNDGLDDLVLYIGKQSTIFYNTGQEYKTREQLRAEIERKYTDETKALSKNLADRIAWLDNRLTYGPKSKTEKNLHDTINTTNSRYDQMIKESRR